MRQAAAWQVQAFQERLAGPGGQKHRAFTVKSLLHDYRPIRMTTHRVRRITGHTANVKCVSQLGQDGEMAVSGSSDMTLRVFDVSTGETRQILRGHSSRIWSCDSSSTSLIASGSGDGTVRIWDTHGPHARQILAGGGGDVYDVAWRPMHEVRGLS